MAPRHGMIVHAGSGFARPKFSLGPRLHARASARVTGARVTLIIIAVSLVVCAIFCCGVMVVMWRSKRAKAKRNQRMAESQPFVLHQYNAVGDTNAGTYTSMGNLQELPPGNETFHLPVGNQKYELPPGTVPRPLDGLTAPAQASTRPVELGSNEAYQQPTWKR